MSIRIGFLGGGKMAQALSKGFLAKGLCQAENLIASAAPQDKQCFDAFQKMGAAATADNAEVVKRSQVVFLSVKPDTVRTVLEQVKPVASGDNLFISICMGTSIAEVERGLPARSRVVRAMPNTPALVGRGASVYACGTSALPGDAALAERLLGAVGIAHPVPEKLLDPVTALSGSGPAYVLLVMEALADGAVREGMPRDLAQRLAAQTVLGTGHLVMETGAHPAKLREDVTSPADLALVVTGKVRRVSIADPGLPAHCAGSTAAGLAHLEQCGARSALAGAVAAATRRCMEMAREQEQEQTGHRGK